MRKYEFGINKRSKDHGLLVLINKSISADCKKNNIDKDIFANEIGTTRGTLENKLKMSNSINAVTIEEFIHIMEITGDYSPLKYLNEMFGFIMTSTEPQTETDVLSLSELADEMVIECGESFSEVKKAAKEGKITEEKKSNMLKEAKDGIEAALKLKQAIEVIQPVEDH